LFFVCLFLLVFKRLKKKILSSQVLKKQLCRGAGRTMAEYDLLLVKADVTQTSGKKLKINEFKQLWAELV